MRSWIRWSVIAAALVGAPALVGSQEGPPACSDGIDNDSDGLVDFPADPDCTGPDGLSESPRDLGASPLIDAAGPDLAQNTGFQMPDGGSNSTTGPNMPIGGGTLPERDPDNGCDCAVGGHGAASGPLALGLGLLLLAVRRRRRA